MTAFIKENFESFGGYVHYRIGPDRKFVARFKYGKGRGRFLTFLRKNFQVEEYFELLNTVKPGSEYVSGGKTWTRNYAPLEALILKGFVSDGEKMLQKMGR